MTPEEHKEILEWLKTYDENETHDIDLCISLKEWANSIFITMIEK